MSQFVAAFDGAFVWRLSKDGTKKEKINVRYINGSKQKALFDIVNPAKNITLPAISINRRNLKRDSNRIQNKDQYMYRPHISSNNVSKIPQPIPVSCEIDVSFVSHYKEDIDQIVSNFVPWCNPYFIISWKIPEEFGMDFVDELRSEVTWSGVVDYEEPVEVDKSEKHRVVANTSFTLKGWIFPALETPVAPIYVIRSDFHALGTGEDFSYTALSGADFDKTDVILISAYPEITNDFVDGRPIYNTLNISNDKNHTFTFYGKRHSFNNSWYLSSSNIVNHLVYEPIITLKYPTISGYKIPQEFIENVNDNITSVSLSSTWLSSGNFTIVTANSAGWVSNNHEIVVI
jgi:hypothetical protein